MDSLTQAALGAGIAAGCVPRGQRRVALLAGAALGTLPDLDVVIRYGDAVKDFTYHRGFSHSLLVLTPLSLLIWAALRRLWTPAAEAPRRWLAAILLTLITHALLDAHTAYGTQLLWPLDSPPVAWSTLFIIDPLFTLPLLVAVGFAVVRPAARATTAVLGTALVVSSLYVGWSWIAKTRIENQVQRTLAARGLDDAPVFSTPTPFNTLLWRVVVLVDGGYLEGFESLLTDQPALELTFYPSDSDALTEAGSLWAVNRLRWFARDFVKAEVDDGKLIVSDLRMGAEPKYVFRHVVAERRNPHWEAIPTQLLETSFDRADVTRLLQLLRPAADAAGSE